MQPTICNLKSVSMDDETGRQLFKLVTAVALAVLCAAAAVKPSSVRPNMPEADKHYV